MLWRHIDDFYVFGLARVNNCACATVLPHVALRLQATAVRRRLLVASLSRYGPRYVLVAIGY